jgi:hypothetical protein
MTKFAYPPAVVFSAYIFFLILFVAAAVLLGMWIVARRRDKERERLELENARLMCKVEHYKREHREAMNKYADAANEAARLSEQLGRMLVSGR